MLLAGSVEITNPSDQTVCLNGFVLLPKKSKTTVDVSAVETAGKSLVWGETRNKLTFVLTVDGQSLELKASELLQMCTAIKGDKE